MSKSTFKGSLLATTVIAGIAVATPAFAQNQTVPETRAAGAGDPD